MKRQWDAEELVEHFTLLPEEMKLLENKSEENRLGFAVLLKFFQMEAKLTIDLTNLNSQSSIFSKPIPVVPVSKASMQKFPNFNVFEN